jgi:toxin ParE1/3/4
VWPVRFTEAARAEIDSVVQRMADNPRQFPIVYKTLRRAPAKKFPYALFFLTEPDLLLVIACFHGSRDPRQSLGPNFDSA